VQDHENEFLLLPIQEQAMSEKWRGDVLLKETLQQIGRAVEEQRDRFRKVARELGTLIRGAGQPSGSSGEAPSVTTFLHNQDIGVVLVDEAGKYRLLNPVAELTLGLVDFQAPMGAGFSIFRADKETRVTDKELPWQQCLHQPATPEALLFVKRLDVNDGIWIRSIALPIHDADGHLQGAVGLFTDTTEQVIVEERIRDLLTTLEQQLAAIKTAQALLLELTDKLPLAEGQATARSGAPAASVMSMEPPGAPTPAAPHAGTPAAAEGRSSASEGKPAALPAPAPAPVPPPIPEPSEPKRVATHNVLLVDDMVVNQKLLSLQMMRLGLKSEMAKNGREAVGLATNREFDLVFMDIDMPVMDGIAATKAIRAHEAGSNRHVPIVAMTSYKRDIDKQRCFDAGMDDYLVKGATRKELLEVVNKFVRQLAHTNVLVGLLEHQMTEPGAESEQNVDHLASLYGHEEVKEVSRLFCSSTATLIDCIQFAIDQKDVEAVLHLTHCVEGPASALGLSGLAINLNDIIAAADQNDWTQVCFHYMKLRSTYGQVISRLKELFGQEHFSTV
jgi:CheY-like chemotaxis protein/PAS domain-containing protein